MSFSVTVRKEDAELIVSELHIDLIEAENALRSSGGDVVRAMRTLIHTL